MNKNVLFRYPGIPLILILLLIFLTACTPGENIAGGEKVAVEGKIIAMEGRVLLNSREAAPGDAVPDKAVITTDETGYCEVTFLESNIIRIFESSIMKISFSEAMLGVERGTAAAVLRNIASLLREDRPFQVESGNVVAGIRGTSFFLKREDTESTYFCLCNGAVEVHDPAGRLELPMAAIHHSAIRIREQNGEISMSRAPMEYHTDKDMESLAARIGQKMDWTRQE